MRLAILLLVLVTACGRLGARAPAPRQGPVLHVRGAELVDGAGRPVVLRGVAFGNQVWEDVRIPREHHAEVDYRRVAEMGMNSVRFYLHYRTFEQADGWQWLDDNVAWAKQHGIYLYSICTFHPEVTSRAGKAGGCGRTPASRTASSRSGRRLPRATAGSRPSRATIC